uniref:Uncharacterized protein n=1 Tax=viral metagenome TaxID=1070528 RepID=A0A6C0AFV4_9ZZZZ
MKDVLFFNIKMDDSEIDKYVIISIMTLLVLILVFLIVTTFYYSRVSQTPNKDLPRNWAYALMIVSIIFIIIIFAAICVCIWKLIRKSTLVPVKPTVPAAPVIPAGAAAVNKPVVLTEEEKVVYNNSNTLGITNPSNYNSNDLTRNIHINQ